MLRVSQDSTKLQMEVAHVCSALAIRIQDLLQKNFLIACVSVVMLDQLVVHALCVHKTLTPKMEFVLLVRQTVTLSLLLVMLLPASAQQATVGQRGDLVQRAV